MLDSQRQCQLTMMDVSVIRAMERHAHLPLAQTALPANQLVREFFKNFWYSFGYHGSNTQNNGAINHIVLFHNFFLNFCRADIVRE